MIRGKVLPQVTDAAMDGCEIFVRRGRMCLSVFRSVIILVLVLGACRASRRSPPSQLTATEEGEVKVRQAIFLTATSSEKIDLMIANDPQLEDKMQAITVSRGDEKPMTDKLRSFFTIPRKLMLWNKEIGSGELKEESEEVVRAFLAENDVTSTHISINEYNPKLIWKRMHENKNTSFLAKITMGNLNALIYTITYGRLTGGTGDGYDPMSDTLVFYSDNLDITLREAGLAVDHDEKNKKGFGTGLYTLGRYLFPIALYQDASAAGKVFKFNESYGDAESIEDAYALIIPSFGMYLAATIILVNKFISKIKGTDDWITKAANAVGKSKTVAKLPEGVKKWATKPALLKWGIIIPVLVGANIVGRVIGSIKARATRKKAKQAEE